MIKQNDTRTSKVPPVAILALIVAVFVAGYAVTNLLARTALNQPASATSSLAVSASAASTAPEGAALVSPPHQVQDFTLVSHTGEPVSLSDLRGEPVMIIFGYTHCPDVCPLTLAEFQRAESILAETGETAHFVFISVDGERDTPEVLANYVPRFSADFIGMTGTEDVLQQIAGDYGLLYSVEKGRGQVMVSHSSAAYLLDQNGFLRSVYFYGAEGEAIAEGIRQLLSEAA